MLPFFLTILPYPDGSGSMADKRFIPFFRFSESSCLRVVVEISGTSPYSIKISSSAEIISEACLTA